MPRPLSGLQTQSRLYEFVMNQAPVRQLSAIMFADIVGYTAMMQRRRSGRGGQSQPLL